MLAIAKPVKNLFGDWAYHSSRFERVIDQLRSRGDLPLRLVLWNGRRFDLSTTPTVTIVIPQPSAIRYFLAPDLAKLGEAFVEGHIRVEGSINDVFRIGAELVGRLVGDADTRTSRSAWHSRSIDRAAIEYHYDVSNDFYALFLDRNMAYSCAYYRNQSDSLDLAQEQKLDYILGKLMLKPGDRFLDIGCGWGALIFRAVSKFGATAKGITLSRNQFDYVRERIRAEGLEGRCEVELCDYRDLAESERFDKIASVGMFEHVGLRNLQTYFRKIHSVLLDGGLVLNHGITASDPDSRWVAMGGGEFIDRYVFPQGELAHISLVLREMAIAGFEVVDIESLRRHYAKTCAEWADRLAAHRERALATAGERCVRIWEIYLAGCAFGFQRSWMNVYQILGCKADGGNSLPMTRDYMYDSALLR